MGVAVSVGVGVQGLYKTERETLPIEFCKNLVSVYRHCYSLIFNIGNPFLFLM